MGGCVRGATSRRGVCSPWLNLGYITCSKLDWSGYFDGQDASPQYLRRASYSLYPRTGISQQMVITKV